MSRDLPASAWIVEQADPDVVASLRAATGLSDVTARILASRGIGSAEEARRFLEPDLAAEWLDPMLIPGMGEAADRVAEAIGAGERILVFGDFDLDGVSAAAVACRGLRVLGAEVDAIVPHRFNEGYGLSSAAIERIASHHPALVVTVDCGISALAEVDALRARGIDVVVTDHHEPGDAVPVGVPVANPKLSADCPSRDLAGAGVSLKLLDAVGARLGQPDTWRDFTDLASLGTVADVVPLRGENRALVTHGVQRIRRDPRVCLASLAAVAGAQTESLGSDSIAFALAPRLNAAGRMADPQVALDLLLADDPIRADELARALDEHNRVRREAEDDLTEAALALAERTYDGERALVLAGEGWHEGVKGIVASRLVGLYRVPAILFAIEDGVAKGSGRSAGTVDLFKAVEACADVVERFGGHEAAVGLTVREERLEEFRSRFLAELDALPAERFATATCIDAELALDDVSVEMGTELKLLEPFGHSNPRPLLASRSVFMNGRSKVGKTGTHLKFTAFDGASSVPAIAFRCKDIDRLADTDSLVDLAYEIDVDEWRGRRRVQLLVRDVHAGLAPPEGPAAALVAELFERADELLAREEYAGVEDAASFHTKLAGVTFEGRQDVLERLEGGAPLRVERQPENPHDPNAVALFDAHGSQVGFLNRRLAAVLAPVIDKGVEYDVEVSEVTGGDAGRSRGVNVVVSRRDLSEESADLEAARKETRAELAAMPPAVLEAELVRRFIGDGALHDAQRRSLDELAAGRNTLTVMATGRGKSLIFHLHAARTALRDGGASVFVYPLRALVADQAYHLGETFSEVGLSVRTVTGESSDAERAEAFGALRDGMLDVVLTTPEFMHFHAEKFVGTGRVRFVVVDEAHHVGLARTGHRPAYMQLGTAFDKLGAPTVLAVTATASDDVADQIKKLLGIQSVVLDPTVRENLVLEDGRGCPDKDARVAALASSGDKVVIYVNSRDKSVQLARMLRKRVPALAHSVAFYNGALSRSVRHAVERAFRVGDLKVVVSTSAFGEGVNIPDIRHVVLYHLPFNDVEFNQMAGRAGRDGAIARIHLLYGERDAQINRAILTSGAPAAEDMRDIYRVLRKLHAAEGAEFEITNKDVAERAAAIRGERRKRGERDEDGAPLPGFDLDERGVSTTIGILRELHLVASEGHGAYRRLSVLPAPGKVDLTASVRYAEGLEEIEEFEAFREWALSATPDELLHRFNRPILPTRD